MSGFPLGMMFIILENHNKQYSLDTALFEIPNQGDYLLHQRSTECNDKNDNGKQLNFLKSTKTNSLTSNSGPTQLLPIRDLLMYTKTSKKSSGSGIVFVSFERTDLIPNISVSFYYHRRSILTKDNVESMGRFRPQLLKIEDTIF